MNNSLVAINIYIKNDNKYILLNPKGIPILFEWNNKSDIFTEFINNKTGYKFIKDNCLNFDSYSKTYISYFHYSLLNNNEKYNDETISIQDILPLEKISDNDNIFYTDFIKEHFNFLYNCVFKEDYYFSDNIFDNDIIKIYNLIKKKYPERIIKETVINYIRSQISQVNKLSNKNCEYIINKLNNILENA